MQQLLANARYIKLNTPLNMLSQRLQTNSCSTDRLLVCSLMTLFVNTGHLDSLMIILLQSELVTVFTIDNFKSMIITRCVKSHNVLLRSFQSTLHKMIFKPYKIMTSLLLPIQIIWYPSLSSLCCYGIICSC